jgi:uncharacterized protein (DUF58 family)
VWLPTRRLFLLAAASAALVAIDTVLGFGALATLAVLFLLDGWLVRRLGPPTPAIGYKRRLGQGQDDALEVEVDNRSRRRLSLQLAAELPSALAGKGSAGVLSLRLAPRERGRVRFPLHAVRRGHHALGAVHGRLEAPLGLAWGSFRHAIDGAIDVLPGVREIAGQRLLAWNPRMRHAGLHAVRQREDRGAFESLREYAVGDDPRRIDWKATARHGRHIVRAYEAERSQSIMLCIDTGRLMGEAIGGHDRLDAAVSAAVVLSRLAALWDDQVGVFAFSDTVHALLPPGKHAPDRIALLLSKLSSRPVEPDYPRAIARLSRSLKRRSLLVFFTDVIDAESSAPLAAHLAPLARRHLPVVVALRHPGLAAAAAARADSRPGAYRRAAATELVLARARLLAGMRRAGILIADVAPEAVVSATVNQYLRIKRSGAL